MNSFYQKNKSQLLKIRRWLNTKLGWDIVRFPNQGLHHRSIILNYNQIDTVIDVGANIGQYGSELRAIGYTGDIISIEPVREAFEKLYNMAKQDAKWMVFNLSLGDFDGTTEINVSQNSVSSSLLKLTNDLLSSAPSAQVVRKETIEVQKLDTFFPQLGFEKRRILLKIDTQGFEKNVLIGGLETLDEITLIQLEMPLFKSYENSSDFFELHDFLIHKGFELFHCEGGFFDTKNAKTLELEGWYRKK